MVVPIAAIPGFKDSQPFGDSVSTYESTGCISIGCKDSHQTTAKAVACDYLWRLRHSCRDSLVDAGDISRTGRDHVRAVHTAARRVCGDRRQPDWQTSARYRTEPADCAAGIEGRGHRVARAGFICAVIFDALRPDRAIHRTLERVRSYDS